MTRDLGLKVGYRVGCTLIIDILHDPLALTHPFFFLYLGLRLILNTFEATKISHVYKKANYYANVIVRKEKKLHLSLFLQDEDASIPRLVCNSTV